MYTNNEIEHGCFGVHFVSFESAIRLTMEQYPTVFKDKKPVGYRVTEQGIEFVFDI